jgi:hypothetical protein
MPTIFLGMKICQKLTQFFRNKIFYHKFPLWKNCLKVMKTCFLVRILQNLCLLATTLRVPWKNVFSYIKIYLGMLITLAPSRNWKKKLGCHIWLKFCGLEYLMHLWEIQNYSKNNLFIDSAFWRVTSCHILRSLAWKDKLIKNGV